MNRTFLVIFAHPDDESFAGAGTAIRIAALRAHRTQHLSIDRCFFHKPDVDRILATEMWRQAGGPTLRKRPAGDVFDGL